MRRWQHWKKVNVDNTSKIRRSTAVVYQSDRQALSTARFRRAGQLATADTCFLNYYTLKHLLIDYAHFSSSSRTYAYFIMFTSFSKRQTNSILL